MLKIAAVLASLGLTALGGSALLDGSWPRSTPAGAPSATDEAAARGKALFRAKGCATCHWHAAVGDTQVVGVGPALTDCRPDPAFVRRWLRDPSAVRPGARMPALGLSEEEIEALIAFLSAGG